MKKAISLLLALAVAGCAGNTPTAAPLNTLPPAETATPTIAPTATPIPHVKLAMGFIPDIQFAPFYVAAEKGYFDEQGIEIEFVTMFENDSVPLIGANELQFANVSAEQVIQARAQGLPVTYVFAWYQKFPIVIASKAGEGIVNPEGLRGRTVGLPGLFGASYIGLRALLASQGIPESDVLLEAIGFTQVEALTADQVQAVVGYASNEPVKLKATGQEINVINVSDYAQLAGNGLVTNEQTLTEHPELVQGMVTALLKGLTDTIADPDEAFEISKKYVETLATADEATAATARQVLAASIELWQAPELGVADLGQWEQTQNTLLQMGLITEPVDFNVTVTNEFVRP
ncbi:MAG: ABC transporter substrate-binding protein [Chloroflexi bacterium]|nr:ABC transporter substrate-binding protein [Chloroflexota bacterium]